MSAAGAHAGALEHAIATRRVVPDVVAAAAEAVMPVVTLGDGSRVSAGAQVPPPAAASQPAVELAGAKAGSTYALACVDPDAPSPEDPKAAEWLHWLVVDIPGGHVGRGKELTAWTGPTPPRGNHRYVFVVLEQRGPCGAEAPAARKKFSLATFARRNHMAVVGVDFFMSAKPGQED